MKKVFVDTAIFRYAASVTVRTHADKRDGYITKAATGERIPQSFLMVSTEIKEPSSSAGLADDISEIADLAKEGKITLCYSHEVNLELFCQPIVDIAVGRFQGASCWIVHSPILAKEKEEFDPKDNTANPLAIYPTKKYDSQTFKYDKNTEKSIIQDFIRDELLSTPINSFMHGMNFRCLMASIREITGYKANTPELIFPLLKTVTLPRYQELLHMLNANGVGQAKQPNTYMDAMHLWAAEEAECDIFLTRDRGIRNQYKSASLRAMKPTDLIAEIKAQS